MFLIRSETLADYPAIHALNYTSFIHWHPRAFVGEPILVDNLRHNEQFDPELSLVAEIQGKLIGHVLLSPFTFYMKGKPKKGCWLAPLCVDPDYQHQKIGSRLIEAVHKVAQDKGFVLCILCGHDQYYPKFGYLNNLFALSGGSIEPKTLVNLPTLHERAILRQDLPWVVSRWHEVHAKDDLANFPGNSLSQWVCHAPSVYSSVFLLGEEPIGFVRYENKDKLTLRDVLPLPGRAELLLHHMAQKRKDASQPMSFTMEAEAVVAFLQHPEQFEISSLKRIRPAFMLKVLQDADHDLAAYVQRVLADNSQAGVLTLPSIMDIDN